MRTRDPGLIAAGIAIGAAAVLLARPGPAAGPRPVEVRPLAASHGSSPPARIPSTTEAAAPALPVTTSAPPPVPAVPPEDIAIQLRGLESRVTALAIEGMGLATGDAAERKSLAPPFEGHPNMGKDPKDLAADRERWQRRVDAAVAAWKAAATPAERASAMKELSLHVRSCLSRGGSLDVLRVLEEAAENGGTPEERMHAVIATHVLWQPEVVDFQLARARSPHPEVRKFAVEGLAWVRGQEQSRAFEGVAAGLEDPDPTVRAMAAMSLGVIACDRGRCDAILARLAREEDPRAAAQMEAAVKRLDPERGEERARAARAR